MNTGGPAFPVPDTHHPSGQVQFGTNGMTLLDWFAGQALEGRAHRFDSPHEHRDLLAQDCYDIAAAMLAEKARREADHSGEANKMVEDHFPDATKMTKLEKQNRELVEKVKWLEEARTNAAANSLANMLAYEDAEKKIAALVREGDQLAKIIRRDYRGAFCEAWIKAKEAKP